MSERPERNLPIDIEWLDGTKRTYRGYDMEIEDGDAILLKDPGRRTVIIPMASVREVTVNDFVLVKTR